MIDDRLTLLIAGLLANALLCGPRTLMLRLRLDAPARAAASALRTLERKLNRERRTPEERRRRGRLVTGLAVATALLAGFALRALTLLHGYYGGVLEIALIAGLLGVRQTADLAAALARALKQADLAAARQALTGTVWRNAAVLDTHGLARAGIETVSVQAVSRLVMPSLYYLLLGLPGLVAARALALLAEQAGAHDVFGEAASRAYAIAAWPASLLAGLLTAGAAQLTPFGQPKSAFAAWLQGITTPHPTQRDLSVTAAALGVSLGGPASEYAPGPWIGGGQARALPRDAERAGTLLWIAALLWLVALGVVRLW